MLVLGNIVDRSLLAYGIVVRSIELCACCGVYHAGVTDLVWWPPGSPGVSDYPGDCQWFAVCSVHGCSVQLQVQLVIILCSVIIAIIAWIN